MIITKTFDEVFDQLYHSYKGKWIQVQVKKEGLILSDFTMHVKDMEIRPLENKNLLEKIGLSRKEKLGSMVFKTSNSGNKIVECLNIPFKLGFNTVDARFVRNRVSIQSCGFEFHIRKIAKN